VTHRYDHRSRRIATERETWGGSAWQPAGTNRYLYDGWNVVAETRSASPANTNLYVWGLDLSSTLQGAGGIGGLLTVRKRLDDGVGLVRNLDYLHDANGNVVQEIMRNDGSIHAHYEYDSFGTTVVATGVDATDNPFRFSTKWFDNDTELGYWGYRWYSPGMGRWVSRDPLGESVSLLLFQYIANSGINQLDLLGLISLGSVKERVDKLIWTIHEKYYLCRCSRDCNGDCVNPCSWTNTYSLDNPFERQKRTERKKYVWNRTEAGKDVMEKVKKHIYDAALGEILKAIAADLGVGIPYIPDIELLAACIKYVSPPPGSFEEEKGHYYLKLAPIDWPIKSKVLNTLLPPCHCGVELTEARIETSGDEKWVEGEWNMGGITY